MAMMLVLILLCAISPVVFRVVHGATSTTTTAAATTAEATPLPTVALWVCPTTTDSSGKNASTAGGAGHVAALALAQTLGGDAALTDVINIRHSSPRLTQDQNQSVPDIIMLACPDIPARWEVHLVSLLVNRATCALEAVAADVSVASLVPGGCLFTLRSDFHQLARVVLRALPSFHPIVALVDDDQIEAVVDVHRTLVDELEQGTEAEEDEENDEEAGGEDEEAVTTPNGDSSLPAGKSPFTLLPVQDSLKQDQSLLPNTRPHLVVVFARPSTQRRRHLDAIMTSLQQRATVVAVDWTDGNDLPPAEADAGGADRPCLLSIPDVNCTLASRVTTVVRVPVPTNTTIDSSTNDSSIALWEDFLAALPTAHHRTTATRSPVVGAAWDAGMIIAQGLRRVATSSGGSGGGGGGGGGGDMTSTDELQVTFNSTTPFHTLFSGPLVLMTSSAAPQQARPLWLSTNTTCSVDGSAVCAHSLLRVSANATGSKVLTSLLAPLPRELALRVAVALPLNVPGYADGRSAEWEAAIDVAAEGLSRQNHGLVTISTSFFDTGQDCAEIGHQIGQQGYHAVIGAVRSSCSGPLSEALREYGVPQVSFASTAPSLSNATRYPTFFRIPPSDLHQGRVLALLCQRFNFTYASLLAQDEAYGQELVASFAKAFGQQNGTIAFKGTLPTSTQPDAVFRDLLLQARASGSSVLLIFGSLRPTRQLLIQARELGMLGKGWVHLAVDANTFASFGSTDLEVDGMVGVRPRTGSGEVYQDWLDYTSETGVGDAFRRRFSLSTGDGGFNPNTYVPHSLDAVQAVYVAASRAADTKLDSFAHPSVATVREGVLHQLQAMTTPELGFRGSTSQNIFFSPSGDGRVVYSIANVASNELTEVGYADGTEEGVQLVLQQDIVWGGGETKPPSTFSIVRRRVRVACLTLSDDTELSDELAAACTWSASRVSNLEGVDVDVTIITRETLLGTSSLVTAISRQEHLSLCMEAEAYLLAMLKQGEQQSQQEEDQLVAVVGTVPSLCWEDWAPNLTARGIPQYVASAFPRLKRPTTTTADNDGYDGASQSSTQQQQQQEQKGSGIADNSTSGTGASLFLLDGGVDMHVEDMLAVLRKNNWTRFATVVDAELMAYAELVERVARSKGFEALGSTPVPAHVVNNETALDSLLQQHRRLDASITVVLAPSFAVAEQYLKAAERVSLTGANWAWLLALGSWRGIHFARSLDFDDAVVVLSPPVGSGSRYLEFLPTLESAEGRLFSFALRTPGVAGDIGPSLLSLRLHDGMLMVGHVLQTAINEKLLGYRQTVPQLRRILADRCFLLLHTEPPPQQLLLTSGERATGCGAGTDAGAGSSNGTSASSSSGVVAVGAGTGLLNAANDVFTVVGSVDCGVPSVRKTIIWGEGALSPPSDIPVITAELHAHFVVLGRRQGAPTESEALLADELASVPGLVNSLLSIDAIHTGFTVQTSSRSLTSESCTQLPISALDPSADVLIALGAESCILALAELSYAHSLQQPLFAVVTEYDISLKDSNSASSFNTTGTNQHQNAAASNVLWLTPRPATDGEALAALIGYFGWEEVNVLHAYSARSSLGAATAAAHVLQENDIGVTAGEFEPSPSASTQADAGAVQPESGPHLTLGALGPELATLGASAVNLLAVTNNASLDVYEALQSENLISPDRVFLASRDLLSSSSPLTSVLPFERTPEGLRLSSEGLAAFTQGMLAVDLAGEDESASHYTVSRSVFEAQLDIIFQGRFYQSPLERVAPHPLTTYVLEGFLASTAALSAAVESRRITNAVPRSEFRTHIHHQLLAWNSSSSSFLGLHGNTLYFDRAGNLQPELLVIRNGQEGGTYREVARWQRGFGLTVPSTVVWADGSATTPGTFVQPSEGGGDSGGGLSPTTTTWVVVVVLLVVFIAVVSGVVVWHRKHQRKAPLDFFQTVRDQNGKIIPKELDRSAISLGPKVGQGAFGDVHRGRFVVDNITIQVAIKTLKVNGSGNHVANSDAVSDGSSGHGSGGREFARAGARVNRDASSELQEFMREASVLCQLKHKNVVGFLGVCTTLYPYLLVTVYADKGSLLALLRERRSSLNPLPLWGKMMMARDIARGLAAVHSHGFVHRDVAARNILVDADFVCKVADFGHARAKVDGKCTVTTDRIAVAWTPPEALESHEFSEHTDIWSYGVTLWEVFSDGARPYQELRPSTIARLLRKGHRLEKPSGCPRDVYILMVACWAQEPKDRLSFQETCETFDTALEGLETAPIVNPQLQVTMQNVEAWQQQGGEQALSVLHEDTEEADDDGNDTVHSVHLRAIGKRLSQVAADVLLSAHLQIPTRDTAPREAEEEPDHSYLDLHETREARDSVEVLMIGDNGSPAQRREGGGGGTSNVYKEHGESHGQDDETDMQDAEGAMMEVPAEPVQQQQRGEANEEGEVLGAQQGRGYDAAAADADEAEADETEAEMKQGAAKRMHAAASTASAEAVRVQGQTAGEKRATGMLPQQGTHEHDGGMLRASDGDCSPDSAAEAFHVQREQRAQAGAAQMDVAKAMGALPGANVRETSSALLTRTQAPQSVSQAATAAPLPSSSSSALSARRHASLCAAPQTVTRDSISFSDDSVHGNRSKSEGEVRISATRSLHHHKPRRDRQVHQPRRSATMEADTPVLARMVKRSLRDKRNEGAKQRTWKGTVAKLVAARRWLSDTPPMSRADMLTELEFRSMAQPHSELPRAPISSSSSSSNGDKRRMSQGKPIAKGRHSTIGDAGTARSQPTSPPSRPLPERPNPYQGGKSMASEHMPAPAMNGQTVAYMVYESVV